METQDIYIHEAISLTTSWYTHQVTQTRIMHLRNWLRENDKHDHNIPFLHLRNMQDCKDLIDNIILAEYSRLGFQNKETLHAYLRENERIFFE
jgi:hypothetical protein